MPVQLTRRNLSAIAKSISGEMKHTAKLDAIAGVLGYSNHAALMSTLKAEEVSVTTPDRNAARIPLEDAMRIAAIMRMKSVSGSHLDKFTERNWRLEVEEGYTDIGFTPWRDAQIEMAAEDCAASMRQALDTLGAALLDDTSRNGRRPSSLVLLDIQDAMHTVLAQGSDASASALAGPFNKSANRELAALVSAIEHLEEGIDEARRENIRGGLARFTASVDPTAEMDDPYPGEPIIARAYSDDHAVEVSFDSRPFLRRASSQEIRVLHANDFSGSYEADAIFYTAEDRGDENVRPLRTYLDTRPRMPNGDTVGFEVSVDGDEAMTWLERYRPEVVEALDRFAPATGM